MPQYNKQSSLATPVGSTSSTTSPGSTRKTPSSKKKAPASKPALSKAQQQAVVETAKKDPGKAQGLEALFSGRGQLPPYAEALAGTPDIQHEWMAAYAAITGKQFATIGDFLGDPGVQSKSAAADAALAAVYGGGPGKPVATLVGSSSFEDRLVVKTRHTYAQVGENYRAAAIQSNAKSSPYLDQIIRESTSAGVPWQLVYGIVRYESGFDPSAVGDGGHSFGLAQIYMPAHPDLTPAQARDPQFAISYVARSLRANFDRLGDWSLAVLAHNSPAAAQHLRATGQSMSNRAVKDQSYVAGVFKGTNQRDDLLNLGFDFKNTNLDAIGQAGGGSAGSALSVPDRTTISQRAEAFLKGWFYRDPTPGETQQLVQMMVDTYSEKASSMGGPGGRPNPYAGVAEDQARAAGQGVPQSGLINPVVGADLGKLRDSWGDPRDGGRRRHQGTDIAAAKGTPVVSAIGGDVVKVTPASAGDAGGNSVWVRGDDGRFYFYAHLDQIAVRGGRVNQGQQLGTVGATGDARGSHLHFGVNRLGPGVSSGYVDPFAELQGATDITGDMTPGGASLDEGIDYEARIQAALRNSNEYRLLYGNKPAYQTEGEYGAQFVNTGQQQLGQAPSGEAVRFGLQTGDINTTAGYVAGTPEALRNKTFRQRLFETAAQVQRML